jgi:hypothetical protein
MFVFAVKAVKGMFGVEMGEPEQATGCPCEHPLHRRCGFTVQAWIVGSGPTIHA